MSKCSEGYIFLKNKNFVFNRIQILRPVLPSIPKRVVIDIGESNDWMTHKLGPTYFPHSGNEIKLGGKNCFLSDVSTAEFNNNCHKKGKI